MRPFAHLLASATAGLVALAVQYAARPAPLPPRGEYFLTELARAQIGPVSIVLALTAAFAIGYRLRASPVPVGLAMLAVFPLIALYEGTRYRGSHNLLPLELAIVATWAVPPMLAAWSGRALARRGGRTPGSDIPPTTAST